MSRAKLAVAAYCTAFALSGLATTSASAGEWDVNGTKLVGTAALLSNTSVLARTALEVVGSGTTVECLGKEININGGELVAPNELRAKDLTFKECKTASGNCSLASETILTLAFHGPVHLEGVLDALVLSLPLPSKTFIVLAFEGSACAFKGVQPVTGTFHLLLHGGKHPWDVHVGLWVTLKGALKLGSSECILSGLSADFRLASGQSWSFL